MVSESTMITGSTAPASAFVPTSAPVAAWPGGSVRPVRPIALDIRITLAARVVRPNAERENRSVGTRRLRPIDDDVSVLFVCTGNQCRSVMAEAMLRARLGGAPVTVSSAGLSGSGVAPTAPGARGDAQARPRRERPSQPARRPRDGRGVVVGAGGEPDPRVGGGGDDARGHHPHVHLQGAGPPGRPVRLAHRRRDLRQLAGPHARRAPLLPAGPRRRRHRRPDRPPPPHLRAGRGPDRRPHRPARAVAPGRSSGCGSDRRSPGGRRRARTPDRSTGTTDAAAAQTRLRTVRRRRGAAASRRAARPAGTRRAPAARGSAPGRGPARTHARPGSGPAPGSRRRSSVSAARHSLATVRASPPGTSTSTTAASVAGPRRRTRNTTAPSPRPAPARSAAVVQRREPVPPAQELGRPPGREPDRAGTASSNAVVPRRSANTSAAGSPASHGCDHLSAATRARPQARSWREPRGSGSRTGTRPTSRQPILRYPGRLCSFGVLNTNAAPSAAQLVERAEREPGEHPSPLGVRVRRGVDGAHGAHRPAATVELPAHERAEPDDARSPARRPPRPATGRTGSRSASTRRTPRWARPPAIPSSRRATPAPRPCRRRSHAARAGRAVDRARGHLRRRARRTGPGG